jgi:nicotinamidase/pyrazinamidase
MNALLIVDLQNDFLPGGALPAPEGDKIIPEINKMMEKFDLVIASKDWHPENSVHFGKWPPHCVRSTEGADFPADLIQDKIGKVFLKGTGDRDDGYSAFEATSDDLDHFLKEKNVTHLFLSGLTTEYCVKSTALDSVNKDFQTYVIKNATEGVKANPGDEDKAYHEMQKAGVKLIHSRDLDSVL